ncbi:MAG: glutathione-disulfide reductase [Usitatibacteraceae bacterium]
MDNEFDLLVIGGGSAGVRLSRMAAQRGVRVAVVENAAMGGTCVNLGCIPKKLYSYASHFAENFEESHGYGWTMQPATFDWDTLKSRRATEISRLNRVYEGLLDGAKVTTIRGTASFVNAGEVEVASDGNARTSVRAKHIVIATGGWPQVPDVPGREHAITSNEIFDLAQFPKRLLVVGGGYIACEFASIFAGLGAKVTLAYRGTQILRGFDEDIRSFVSAEMIKKGVDIRLHADVRAIALEASTTGDTHAKVATFANDSSGEYDAILYATGRHANTATLGLMKAGVATDSAGAVIVNEEFQTSVPSIFAIGDVIDRVQLTPVALGEAMTLLNHLYGDGKRKMDYEFIPTAVFTNPNIGTVGFSEADARARFGKLRIYRSEFRPLLHTLSGSTERCLMKLVVEDASDRVVGLHMVGAHAGEIVQGFAVAMKAGATKAVFDQTIGIHPTAAEEFVTMREPVPAAG